MEGEFCGYLAATSAVGTLVLALPLLNIYYSTGRIRVQHGETPGKPCRKRYVRKAQKAAIEPLTAAIQSSAENARNSFIGPLPVGTQGLSGATSQCAAPRNVTARQGSHLFA